MVISKARTMNIVHFHEEGHVTSKNCTFYYLFEK